MYIDKYKCEVCGYIYDKEENGNISFEDMPDNYQCILCGADKDMFELI